MVDIDYSKHFKNLTIKKHCPESKQILLENDFIQTILDSDNSEHIVLSPNKTFDDLTPLEQFYIYGVTTIPIYDLSKIDQVREKVTQELIQFPEYLRNDTNRTQNPNNNKLVYVLGGFGALGNPGSFHNLTVRDIRIKTYKQVTARLLKDLIKDLSLQQDKDYYLETLFDRLMNRIKGTAPTPESWHRDVAKDNLIDINDEILGGWINLDNKSQFMSCIPGSHLGVRLKGLKGGFATIGKKDIDKFKPYRRLFEIKPGHCIIFPQYILHEVVSKKSSYDMMRLFIGWYLSTNNTPFYTKNVLDSIINKQGTPILPSGQKTPMYSANHMSFYLHKPVTIDPTSKYKASTIEWSHNNFKPEMLVDKTSSKGESYKIINRFLTNLEDYNLPKYPEYSEIEKRIYYPHKL